MGEYFSTATSLFAEEEVPYSSVGATVGHWTYVIFLAVLVFGLIALARKGMTGRVFHNPWTSAAEQLYLFVENMCVGTIGAHGRKYIPMIMTFWLMIFVGNVLALFFPTSPTATLSFNLGMAIISIAYVQYEGIKTNGLFGHVSHFAGPKLSIFMIPITLMIFVIEIISELMKNVSLSLRLYGNIHGGHEAVHAMNRITEKWYIPAGEFLLPIKLLTCVVQALVFTLLTCVYLSLVTSHGHDDDHGSHGDGGTPALAH